MAVVVAALVLAAPASAGQNHVDVEDDFFAPKNSTQFLNSDTLWSWQPTVLNEHNVREDSKLFYSGPLTDDPKTAYDAQIPAGTFHYYCELHGDKRSGMEGVVKVKPAAGPPNPDLIGVTWGDSGFETAVQYDVQFKVNDGKWKSWLKNTNSLSGDFGASDEPVDVKPGKTYRFRARTEKASNPDKRSDYSPALKVSVGAR
jgi:plastocyanin